MKKIIFCLICLAISNFAISQKIVGENNPVARTEIVSSDVKTTTLHFSLNGFIFNEVQNLI